MAIRTDILAEADRKRRSTLKGEALARLPPRTVTRQSGDVEIQSLKAIDRSVEVMIRAWDPRGNQRGFGSDGSVEIERIRIINPPILVPDAAGPIDLSWVDDNGVLQPRRFREDLDEALLQAVDHVLRVVPTHGPVRIQRGRIGRTISTIYAGGGDGYVENAGSGGASWATVHAAATGTLVDDTTNPLRVSVFVNTSSEFQIRRAFLPFDTSSLPDDDVTSAATFSMYVNLLVQNGDDDGDDFFVPVGPTTQASPTALAIEDYDQCGSVTSPTEFSNDRKDYSAHSADIYADWAFNASGIANISTTGYTLVGVREGHDVLDSAYAGALNTSNQIRYASSEASGTTTDPVLVITHAEAVLVLLQTMGRRVYILP